MDCILASHPAAPGLILGVTKDLFLTEISSLDVGEIHQQRTAYQRVDSAKLNICSNPSSTNQWQAGTTKKC